MAGLFDGIDTRSQAELLKDRASRRAQAFEQIIPKDAPLSSQMLFRAGGMLQSMLKKRFGFDKLPETQQAQAHAVSAAKKRFEDYKAAYPEASIEDQGLEWQKALAEELLKVGDPKGAELAAAYAQTAQARERAKLEIQRLEGQVQDEATERENWRVLNTLKPIWLKDDNYLSNSRMAFIKPDGTAEYLDENGNVVEVPRGQYTWTAPARPNQERGSGSVRDLISPSNRLQLINLNAAIGRQVDAYMNMWKAINESATATGQVNFLSKAGAIQSWVTDWANTLSAGARALGSQFGVDGKPDLTRPGNALKYVQEHPDLVESMKASMPPEIAANAQWAQRYTAAATQLAYARGTSLEPGQTRMTDQDFQVMIQTIGASASSPETFRQIALANMMSDIDNYQTVLSGYYPEEQSKILNPTALKRVQEKIDLFMNTFSSPFGEADNPGPGVRSSNSESDDEFLNRILN